MNFDNGDGSGMRRMSEAERLSLHAAMEREETQVLEDMARAAAENKRKDAARWQPRAVDKVLAEFQTLGFAGFQVVRNADGELVFSGVPYDVPSFIKEKCA